MHGHIQALIDAISAARVKHDQTAEELVKTRDLVQARGERFQAQLGRFAALGKEAAESRPLCASSAAQGQAQRRGRGQLTRFSSA